MSKGTVVVGMSGGVDSSVAAYLLKKEGYDVIGVTMQIWQDEEAQVLEKQGGCCGTSAVEDARRVADALEIPYYVMNFKEEFQDKVIDYFTQSYLRGETPNPCIACNRYIKWESLLQRSMEIGADYIATGHYARVRKLDNGRYTLQTAAVLDKDQTYALYNLTQDQLARTLMPDGAYSKPQIREIAEEIGLIVANKPDSQDICFVPDNDYAGFIERETGKQIEPGNFVTKDGEILGRHKGITHYTIGQRKGLGLSIGHPVFVSEIRPQTNEVVVGEEDAVFTTSLFANDVNWMAIDGLHGEPLRAIGKIRYAHKGAPCTVTEEAGGIRVIFDQPVRAVTPGQSVVFYDEEGLILGGGTIQKEE